MQFAILINLETQALGKVKVKQFAVLVNLGTLA